MKQRPRDDCRDVVQFTIVVMDGDFEASIRNRSPYVQRGRWIAKVMNTLKIILFCQLALTEHEKRTMVRFTTLIVTSEGVAKLRHLRTVQRFTYDVIEKFAGASAKDKLCIISFDEMQLKPKLAYQRGDDVIEGFADHGSLGRANACADHALVMMVRGKYFYLKQHLDGDAARAIQGLPLTAENYPEAVRILQHRFGKDDVRKDTLVAKLLSLPGVTDADNIKSLRKLTDEVTAGVRSLRALDITNIGEVLLPVLKGKIPASWRLQWARLRRERATDDENTEFESFLRFLQQEVECQEESVQVLCQKKREESSQPANRATTKQPEGLDENIELADDFSGGQVDILIGTDQYYKVVLRDCVVLDESLRALDTIFGYVIHWKGTSTGQVHSTCMSV
ncbi:hypothetical protein FJT64_008285 [Amphibalanus amphitrite]|uniref:Uncharacterized protein n=1 Tax=Amphibalanus amphitrite TaxID=1232801 RepID=A0A6A4VHQ5_AMPAM|nr:hypothetical protein FJT64_008285 [Amphibalanus amphitrite]